MKKDDKSTILKEAIINNPKAIVRIKIKEVDRKVRNCDREKTNDTRTIEERRLIYSF